MTTNFDKIKARLADKINLLPTDPGVYKMFDESGKIIYVGKAKNLRNRVRTYFRKINPTDRNTTKVRAMVSHIHDFEYVVTKNESEALTLEANLIKQYQPHYNILLKDDKHFPYIRVDLRKDYPVFTVVKRLENDGAKYLGPYISTFLLRDALTAIRDYFPVRHCKKDIEKSIAKRERPCLMYHIHKCCAPCSGNVSREEYHRLVSNVIDFLQGNTSEILADLEAKMKKASDDLDFETAAVYRDRIIAISALAEKQQASTSKGVGRDVFAVHQAENDSLIYALFVRDGKVIGTQSYFLKGDDEEPQEVIGSFLKQFYTLNSDIPKEILLSILPDEHEAIEEWFKELSGHSVHIVLPQRGDKKALVDMAIKNAQTDLEKRHALQRRAWERGEGALMQLAQAIGLDYIPTRIECYDNSHLFGRDMVGAMIVFTNGQPDKKGYRRFRIKMQEGGDDYLAMREVLTRRFERALKNDEKFIELPDLIIVDGGRGQLNVALEVLEQYSFEHIPVIGLAERNEEIIQPDNPKPLTLDRHSAPQHLIERIRDEAHRFAITYHRNLRSKSALYSVLDNIEGIGEKRKRALFDKFITIDAIKQATVEQLLEVKGMTRPAAEKVYAFFHKEKAKSEGDTE